MSDLKDEGATGPSDVTPTLSLVVATLGRDLEVRRLLESLARQDFTGFDVTIVDQNEDDRLAAIASETAWPFRLKRIHTPGERGASRARNTGWRQTSGRLVLFPDDDSWFAADFTQRAVSMMADYGCDILSGRPTDEAGRSINGRWPMTSMRINRGNVWSTAIEWLVVFKREVLETVQGFDENVGVGAASPWQSCEIQDILLRAIERKFVCWFDPSFNGHHEEIVVGAPTLKMRRKARAYARGMGFVLADHGFGAATKLKWLARPVAGALLSLARGRFASARYHSHVAIGRAEGTLKKTIGTGWERT